MNDDNKTEMTDNFTKDLDLVSQVAQMAQAPGESKPEDIASMMGHRISRMDV